jgi:ATP-dependent protease ClpP protease subunit
MAKKKPETKIEETLPVENEQMIELQNCGMQTVMSIGLAERLYLEDRQDRVLYLDGVVNDDTLHTCIMQICKINGEDYGKPIEQRVPITLIINCRGGNTMIGMALVNTIQDSTTPVIGVCLGVCASMAFAIFAVCHTRIATKDSTFMVHDGSIDFLDTTTKAKDFMNFNSKLEDRYNKAIAEKTKFTVKELDEISPHDSWFFADELVEYDMIDGIIGKDIDLEAIFSFMSNDYTCDEKCNCEE